MFQRGGRLEKEVTELRGTEGGNVMWGQQSLCLKPVSSTGLSPVPLGGIPVLAMAVLFSGLFF